MKNVVVLGCMLVVIACSGTPESPSREKSGGSAYGEDGLAADTVLPVDILSSGDIATGDEVDITIPPNGATSADDDRESGSAADTASAPSDTGLGDTPSAPVPPSDTASGSVPSPSPSPETDTSAATGTESSLRSRLFPPDDAPGPGSTHDDRACEYTNGMFLPSNGVMNALVLFIRYEDEDIDNAWWPADGFPDGWQTFIDETPEQRRTNTHNLTHFYREVSRNAATPFTLIGTVDTVTARIPLPNGMDYGESNRAVLQQVESRYNAELGHRLDQWTRAENCHNRVSNGDIDLIIMIWRTNRFRNSTINWSGIAHIGGSRTPAYTFLGKNVKLPAFNANFSSGVTVATRERSVRDRLLNADVVFKSTVHEIAHQQITYNHPQGGSDGQQRFPSMLAYAEQEIHSHNGLEADLLGWGRAIRVSRDTTITLGDFFQTGESVWVETSGYRYLIENRQNTSIYDDASVNPDDKGLFVYQYRSERNLTLGYDGSNNNIFSMVSDGFYDWEFSGRWLPGWRAIFNRGDANASEGSGFTRKQPSTGNNHHWISAMVIDGDERPYDFRGAGLRAAFNMDRPRLGADTNPSVNDLELEVLGQEGNAVRFRVRVK
ncbi:MAG: hypothetical protein JJU41_06405 [Bacteroidetes bacterium]|nr:hypothetical protein [Bacteroidota bacterium]